MNDLSDFTSADLAADADRLFIARRARELAAQMDSWNRPGTPYPSNEELQSWAGYASGILKMVGEDA